MDWKFHFEYVVTGEGKDAKFYRVSFINDRPESVSVAIDARWKSCSHDRTVWQRGSENKKPGKKVAAIITEAVANWEAKKAELKKEKLENVESERTATDQGASGREDR